MKFKTASSIESTCFQMRLGDYPRAQNRAKIEELFNGFAPFSQEDLQDNLAATNVNELSAPVLAHEARKNFMNALLKPGNFFTVKLDTGPAHKRDKWATIITSEINKLTKRSLKYFEVWRSTIGSNVLHGIAPKVWPNQDSWCPDAVATGDVLVPSGTYLTMENLPFFAVQRRYTAFQLMKLTSGPRRDKAWNMKAVNAAIKWANDETVALSGTQWPETWQPERMAERMKEDSGLYAGDAVPTIDCLDFYYWDDADKVQGWRRRIVLDAWGGMGAGGVPTTKTSSGEFLFDPGNRVFADNQESIMALQFADLSATAPFRWHSVRSVGFLLYAICHLQNRLFCRFNDALFEHMMQYFRIASDDDVGRALKVNLIDKGFIDRSVQFVPPEQRWRIDKQLVEMGFEMNSERMGRNASSMVEGGNTGNVDHMKASVYAGEMQKANALVGAALQQAYNYAVWEYREICRRFCRSRSQDMDVSRFQASCLTQGVPKEQLDVSRWEVYPDQVMGGGNQMLEQNIAQQLMQFRPLYDPEAQRLILRKSTLAITSDARLTDALVPDQQERASQTVTDTQRACAVLMLGLHADPLQSANRQELIQTCVGELALLLKRGIQSNQDIIGMQAILKFAEGAMQLLMQDKSSKQIATKLGQELKQVQGMIQEAAQKFVKQQQAAAQAQQQNGNGGLDPKDKAKIEATLATAKTKMEVARESHAQRSAQRQAQFELRTEQDAQRHAQDMVEKAQDHAQDLHEKAADHALNITAEKRKSKIKATKTDA